MARTRWPQPAILSRNGRARRGGSGGQVLLRLLAILLGHRLPSIRDVQDTLVVDPAVDGPPSRRGQLTGGRRPRRCRAWRSRRGIRDPHPPIRDGQSVAAQLVPAALVLD